LRLLVDFPKVASGAIIISSFAHKTPHFNAMGESWKLALDTGGYSLFSDVLLPWALSPNYYENPLIPVETLKMIRNMNPIVPERLYRLMFATDKSKDYRKNLQAVEVPVRVLVGSADITTPPFLNKEIANHIPNAHYTELQGKGHTLNLEAIPEIILEVKALAKVIN